MGQGESYQVPTDGDWKQSWNDTPGASSKCGSHRQKMAVHQNHAASMEALLAHYPWIVYLGVTFWRKLVIRVWFEKEHKLKDRLPNLVGIEPQADETITNCHLLRRLGISGRLDVFSTTKLHPTFLSERVPLTLKSWGSLNPGGEEEGTMEEYISDFLIGLFMADQVDAVHCLVVHLQLDPGFLLSKKTNKLESSPLRLSLRHSPPHSSLLMWLLFRCHSSTREDLKLDQLMVEAAQRGLPDVMIALMRDPFCVDVATAVDGIGLNSLDYAAAEGHIHVVNLLLDLKEQRGTQKLFTGSSTFKQNTPLHFASGVLLENDAPGCNEIVKLLIEEGADVNASNADGLTPLHYAARLNHTEIKIATTLVKNGADINAKAADGDTPLHESVNHRAGLNPWVQKLLLRQPGIDVNPMGWRGRTPLHKAAAMGHLEQMSMLLEEGALATIADTHSGATPLHLVASERHVFRGDDVVSLLLHQSGVDINKKDNNGKTALDLANSEKVRVVLAKAEERCRPKLCGTPPPPDRPRRIFATPNDVKANFEPSVGGAVKTAASPDWLDDDF